MHSNLNQQLGLLKKFFFSLSYVELLRSSRTNVLKRRRFNAFSNYKFKLFMLKVATKLSSKKLASAELIVFKNLLGYVSMLYQRHFFHMVTASPWPLVVSVVSFFMLLAAVLYMHLLASFFFLSFCIFLLILIIVLWVRDVKREGTADGMHTKDVRLNIRMGFLLFIVTEIMFFFGFFWAFFHASLAPAVELGCVWPPVGLSPLDPLLLPLLNTSLLLQSGLYITLCHFFLQRGNISAVMQFFIFTLIMGFVFTLVQAYEYTIAPFSISDSVYGSTFFLLTGFHGLHVIVGTILISVAFWRAVKGHFSKNRHVGFEIAAWYWHFVDVVWLGLFICLYVWGNN